MSTSPRIAVLLTIAAAFFWGSNFAAAKLTLTSLPPWTASAERFTIAAICIVLFLAVRSGIRFSVLRQNVTAFVLLGVVGVAGFNGALFVGL